MSFAPYHLYGAIKAAIDQAVRKVEEELGKGHWPNEAKGKRLCGRIDGLKQAKEIVTAEYQKFETLDEDEE